MAGAYGDFLNHFPELYIKLPYFNQTAKIGAGYTPVGEVTYIDCIRQTGPGRRLSGSTHTDFSTISTALKINDNLDIWCEVRLNVGWFMLFEGEVYRVPKEKDWVLEGGFYCYHLEKVVGNSGSAETELPVKVGDF